MNEQSFSYSTGAQLWRILKTDTRIAAVDLCYGMFYVLMGMYMIRFPYRTNDDLVILPFVTLSAVVIYFFTRIMNPEHDRPTAMFFANFPRPRTLTYAAHILWIFLFILLMEFLILLLCRLHYGSLPVSLVGAMMPMAVLSIIAVGNWPTYRWRLDLIFIFGGLFFIAYLVGSEALARHSLTTLTWRAIVVFLLTPILLWFAGWRWARVQIGELT